MFHQKVQRVNSDVSLQQQNQRFSPGPRNDFKPLPLPLTPDVKVDLSRFPTSDWIKNDPLIRRWAREDAAAAAAAAKSSDTSNTTDVAQRTSEDDRTFSPSLETENTNSTSSSNPSPDNQIQRKRFLEPNLSRFPTSDWIKNDPLIRRWAREDAAAAAKSSDTPSIQAKLTVSTPGDKYELEADAMAAKVMAMPHTAIEPQQETPNPTTAVVQRAVNEDKTVSTQLENRIQNATGGSPLPSDIRSFMEPRFGVDFSEIRVHTDSNAAAMCSEVGAKAFAVGNRIYYGAEYAPGNNELTAHELTHTIQQGATKRLTKQIRQQPAPSPSQTVKKITPDDIPEKLKRIPINSFEQPSPTKKLNAKQFTPDCISQKPNRISLKLSEILTPKAELTPKQFTPDSLAANFNKFSPEISEKQIGAKKLQPQLSTPSQSSPQIQRNPIAQLESLGQLKDILTRVLGNASGVIGSIIKNPVGFATNLVSALRQGFGQFVTNIRTHLQNGLVNWLTGGSLGSIRQPISLSNPQGIFNLTLQILGVGGNYIRSRAVNKFGATFVSRLEKSVSLFQQLKNNGLLGMFSQIQQQLGNLQTTVVEGIRKFLIERVIQAGVKWILGLLVLPISGVVKAAQTVYQVLDFFINQASRVAALVQAVTTAVQTVASGKTGVAAKAVEEALARAIPVLMGFLANLAGVGGNLAPKIRSLLAKVKARIDAVIDGLLERAKGLLLRQGNGQVRGNGGQTSSRTTGQSPPTNRQNSQQNKPNSVLRNNQISAPNNRQNPQQKMPNPAGQNNQRPATNNRQNQQQQQTKLDHDRKVRVGLNQINQEEKKYLDNGKIYREDARKIAAKVKQAHPIFKAITVIDGGKSWNYKWVASEGIDEGPEKAEPIAEQNLRTAKQHFQDREFTAEELATVIRENPRTAVRRIKIWRENDRIFQVSNNLYTFAAIGTSLERAKERFQQNQFTTAQLAEALRLEIRTAQRSVKEWLDRQENTGLYRVPATKDKYAFDPKLAPSQTQQQGGHQSTYVDPQTWEILLQYRDKIRDRFYKKNYRQDRLAEVLKRAYAGKDPQGNELYRCSYTNSPQLQGPKHKDLSVYQVPGVTGGEIDHITDVTQHWELHGGKNMTQAQRGEWYDNSDNLQFLCASCNRAKPKGIFTFKVGRDFRGPNEK